MNELEHFLTHLTTEPGVYRMLDADGQVLYVGKANHLKQRVNSYFKQSNTNPKTRALVRQIKSVEISVTRSETEALLLESSLIKTLKPKYNVLMRDDKSYPYIYLSTQHPFPRLTVVRRKQVLQSQKPEQGLYFGPYPSASAVRETVVLIQKVFKIRNCQDLFFQSRTRPCLQYQIQRCTAPCVDYVTEQQYQHAVKDVIRFLQGKSTQILSELTTRMDDAVERLAFEEAATIRDHIKKLRQIQEQQGVLQLRGEVDVIVIEGRSGFACIQWVSVREGQVKNSEAFFPVVPLQRMEEDTTLFEAVFAAFVQQHYLQTPSRIPRLILIDQPLTDRITYEKILTQLSGAKIQIKINPRGVNAKWMDFAKNNLRAAVEAHQYSAQQLKIRFQALQQFLKWPHPIERMACFDVSHTQGHDTVASCVVFDQGGPCKREYRRYNIKGITPGDDYAALRQALMRRLNHAVWPDVLIVDGGKGQLAVAEQVVHAFHSEAATKPIKLLGIAKGPGRKPGLEQLILAESHQEVTLPSDSPALHLLQHIRDEAHRFAITAHRKKRQKTSLESAVDHIPGIGARRRQALLKYFGGVRELSHASVDELAKVTGIHRALAERIFSYFH